MASNKISSDAQKIMDALAASISKDLGIKKEDVDLQAFQVSEELLKNILENVKKEASKESDAVTGIATMKASYTANKKTAAEKYMDFKKVFTKEITDEQFYTMVTPLTKGAICKCGDPEHKKDDMLLTLLIPWVMERLGIK